MFLVFLTERGLIVRTFKFEFRLCFLYGKDTPVIEIIQKISRPLTPSEHRIIKCLCTGQSNAAIARRTNFSIKCVENSISRSAKILGVKSGPDVNLRVLLVIACLSHFQNPNFNPIKIAVDHL